MTQCMWTSIWSIDPSSIDYEIQQLAQSLLLHLARKLPPRRWWFIPRNELESTAENAMSTMLSIGFVDLQPICVLSGVLYDHVASNGSNKGEIVTSFNPKVWSQMDPNGDYTLLSRRPRIDGAQRHISLL